MVQAFTFAILLRSSAKQRWNKGSIKLMFKQSFIRLYINAEADFETIAVLMP